MQGHDLSAYIHVFGNLFWGFCMINFTCRAFWLTSVAGLAAVVGIGSIDTDPAQARSASLNLPSDIRSFGYHQRIFQTKPLEQHIGFPSPPPRKPEPKHPGLVFADTEQWDQLAKLLPTIHDPAMKKLLTWLYLKSPDSQASHAMIVDFLRENPNWPSRNTLIFRAEDALFRSANDYAMETWFANGRANTLEGEIWLIDKAKHDGKSAAYQNRIRRVWKAYDFTEEQEEAFLKAYGSSLRTVDHETRADRLIWERKFHQVRRQLERLPHSYRLLIESKLAYASMSRKAPMAYDRVDKDLRNDPGLIFEKIRWLRRKGKETTATDLFLSHTGNRPFPDKWWNEAAILTRDALKNGEYDKAYKLATHATYDSLWRDADLQWLAGWTAFEFLQDYTLAKTHFQKLYDMVSTPVSRTRGAYWLAQSLEKLGNTEEAMSWYQTAASDPTAYYGQLAADHLKQTPKFMKSLGKIPETDMAWVTSHEFSNVLWRLHENGEQYLFRVFATALYAQAKTPERKRAVVSAIASLSLGQSVHLARVLRQDGIIDLELSYPVPDGLDIPAEPSTALIYSVIRQESNFDTTAHSPAGAKGLMQIMPRTAKYEARLMNRPLSMYALTTDPSTNVAIGSHYLKRLLEKYDQSIPLALAAYNAGGSNVNKWLQTYGDPRTGEISMLRWMESIPFRETRNYVQRILENKYIYQGITGKS